MSEVSSARFEPEGGGLAAICVPEAGQSPLSWGQLPSSGKEETIAADRLGEGVEEAWDVKNRPSLDQGICGLQPSHTHRHRHILRAHTQA